MSFFVAGAIVATSLYQADQAKSAAKKAKKDAEAQALEDQQQAAKAEAFAESEEGGLGSLGKVDLALDDELETDQKIKQTSKASISI